jgi:hypothetical protein
MEDQDAKTPAGFLDNTQAAALGDRLRRVNGKLLFWSTVAFAIAGVQVAGRAKGLVKGISGLEFLNTPVFLSFLDKVPFVRHLGFVKGTTDFITWIDIVSFTGAGIVWHKIVTKPLLVLAQWYTIARPKAGTKASLTAQVVTRTAKALFARWRQSTAHAPALVPRPASERVGGAVAATLALISHTTFS